MTHTPTPESVRREVVSAVRFNAAIDLYETVRTNENFFIGKQWEGVRSNGLPTPVFNFLKRVVLFSVANVTTDNLKLRARPLAIGAEDDALVRRSAAVLNELYAALFERDRVGALLREFCRNAAVDGDGCIYCYFDGRDVAAEVLRNTQVYFGDPNDRDVQSQPYILIERRERLADALRYGRAHGCPELENVVPDAREAGDGALDHLGGEKVSVYLRLWKEEDGQVWACECTRRAMLRAPWPLGLTLYPLVWMSWDFIPDSYHGQAMLTGLIPNQIFVNKLFAMSMVSLMTLAYPKVIYDRTRIAAWSGKVGAAIGVNGSVDGAARIVDPASISPQISQFIETAISYTQRFLGATDAALGDTKPENASAILALQRASAVPAELTRRELLSCVEQLGRIYADMAAAFYGVRSAPTADGGRAPFDFAQLRAVPCAIDLDAGPGAYWSEIANMQTLDNLLLHGRIPTSEYLKRLPADQITDRDALIAVMEAAEKA